MRRLRRGARRLGAVALATLAGGLIVYTSPGSVRAQDQTVATARGAAYGVSESTISEPNIQVPSVEAAVPPPSQKQVMRMHDEDELVNVLDLVGVATVRADACLESGVSAKLQEEIDGARAAAGAEGVPETPPRAEVTAEPGFNDGCVTGSPIPSPGEGGGGSQPAGTNCEDLDEDAVAEGTTCLATLPLWHGRGYARTADVLGQLAVVRSEAVARCVGERIEVATGAAFSVIEGSLMEDPSQPNQPLDPLGLGIAGSSAVTFWETNWDPRTNTTVDGSETVWVNGLHIITPAQEIIVGHAEATASCPDTDFPPGGFPRDISLSPSKRVVLYARTFTLSGAVTPATEFFTPKRCVENVVLTIRKDPVGGPVRFVDVATVETDDEGHFTFNYGADRNAQWLAWIDKNNPQDCALSTSHARPVLVRPLVRLRLSSRSVAAGSTVRFTTTVSPCEGHEGTRVKLKQQVGSSMVKVDQVRLDDSCTARFFRPVSSESVFQVSWPKQDDDHQTGKSRRKVVRTF